MGRWREAPEGLRVTPACRPHSWGGVGAADGGAVGYSRLSSPFMGRCRRSRRRGCRLLPPVLPIHGVVSAQPTEGLLGAPACPPHSWGGVGAADGGAVGYPCSPSQDQRGIGRSGSICVSAGATPLNTQDAHSM